MKSWHLLIVVVVLSFSVATIAEAATITITIDGDSVSVPTEEGVDENGKQIFYINSEAEPYDFQTANGRVILGGYLYPDPNITFAGAAFDFGAPSVFGMTIINPLAPDVTNPSFVKDSLAGSVTNGPNPQFDGGVTVTAMPPLAAIPVDSDGITEMEVYTMSDDNGATWNNVGLDLGPTVFTPLGAGGSGDYGSFNEGWLASPSGGPWTDMRADITFMLSGNNDVFTFNGAKTLVPEPSAALLAFFAIATLGFFRRRTAE